MKKVFNQTIEKYYYDTEEERNNHVKEMEKNGWVCSGQVKKFIGNIMFDNTYNEKNYVWFAQFCKNL